jgi:hypothetical protein
LVLRSYRAEVMEAALATLSGESRALADVAEIEALSAALDEAGTYAAFFTLDTAGYAYERFVENLPEGASPPEEIEALLPYTGLATGPGLDGDQAPIAVFAFSHADEESAAENATRLDGILSTGTSLQFWRPWSEMIERYEIATAGTVVVATLWTGGPPRLWVSVPSARDSLLVWSP